MTRSELWLAYNTIRFWLVSSVLTAEERPVWLDQLAEVLQRLEQGEGW